MDCDQIREQLGGYLDGEWAADARRTVEAHLKVCTPCEKELACLKKMAAALASEAPPAVPDGLWERIEAELERGAVTASPRAWGLRGRWGVLRRPVPLAASVLLVVGLGLLGVAWFQGGAPPVEAATIDFGILLDGLALDPDRAFRAFLERYAGRIITPQDAPTSAPALNFALPEVLPGGFRRQAVYLLRFGDAPGIAARYVAPGGDFLAAIFHPPVQQEDFGTHRDYPCVIGEHRGHSVSVGPWHLTHLTDPTTCHCVLSQVNVEKELPAVMAAVAPASPAWTAPRDDH